MVTAFQTLYKNPSADIRLFQASQIKICADALKKFLRRRQKTGKVLKNKYEIIELIREKDYDGIY